MSTPQNGRSDGWQASSGRYCTTMASRAAGRVMTIVGNWPAKGHEKIGAEFVQKSGEPWMTQDSLSTYGDMWIFKEAMEKAGSADKKKVAEAIRTMDSKEGSAKFFPGGRMKFDEQGRRVDADLVIVQWQNGVPVTVYPDNLAVAKPFWPKA